MIIDCTMLCNLRLVGILLGWLTEIVIKLQNLLGWAKKLLGLLGVVLFWVWSLYMSRAISTGIWNPRTSWYLIMGTSNWLILVWRRKKNLVNTVKLSRVQSYTRLHRWSYIRATTESMIYGVWVFICMKCPTVVLPLISHKLLLLIFKKFA